jgi:nitroimidazol reductase NimA-like FMN-containing flavoprotein (pyridoxamine 5'-phosphate oxidase superfamily)
VPFDRSGLEIIGEDECFSLLRKAPIGRVAVVVGAVPAVFPVNYAVLDRDIVFATAPGAKLAAAIRGAVVAFEVDEIDRIDHAGWSVVVTGPCEEVVDPVDLNRIARLHLAPWAKGDRERVVRIRTHLVSGRRLSHNGAGAPATDHVPLGGGLTMCPECGGGEFRAAPVPHVDAVVCWACGTTWRRDPGGITRIAVAPPDGAPSTVTAPAVTPSRA